MNTENNKLIAEFMGLDVLYDCMVKHPTAPLTKVTLIKYHESWEWLMPVVEKIEGTKTPEGFYFDFDILSTGIVISNAYGVEILTIDNDQLTSMGKMQAVYNACVGFIKWYNEKYNITYETN